MKQQSVKGSSAFSRAFVALLLLAVLGGEAGAESVTRGQLMVTFRDPADRALLAEVFRTWEQARVDLKGKGLTLPPTTLVAARSAADFAALAGAPANIAALTRGERLYTQRLASLKGKGLLPLTIRHEAFHRAQPPGLPHWLAEGLARTFSGEGLNDPTENTGLEGVTETELNDHLLTWKGHRLTDAYREATRRAARLLSRFGWAGTLQGKR